MKQSISNTSQVKSYNVDRVKAALKSLQGGTKITISRITGLSVATCNTILNELSITGEILEVESEYSNLGRPAKVYKFNGNYSYIFCIFISYENRKKILNYAVVNLLGSIIKEQSIVKEHIDYDVIEKLVQETIDQYDNITAIGIGIPGVVNRKNVIDFCDIEELSNCDLAERLTDKFGKSIVIENDMNSIAYGFYQGQKYEVETSIVVVAFLKDNWPGSGIIVDGNIVRGNTNFAGEVSYLPFDCTHDEQKDFLKDRGESIQIVAKTLCSLTAIINPETIVITGTIVTEEMLEDISKIINKVIPGKHIPQVILEDNTNKYYLSGLSSMTLKYLNSKR